MRFRRLGTGLKLEPPSEVSWSSGRGGDTDIEAWFQTALGREICDTVYRCVSRLIPSGYYRTGFQVGFRNVDLLQKAEHVYWGGPCQGSVSVNSNDDERTLLVCDPENLPFGARSIDLMALPFVLDFSANPHAVLREAYGVLAPEGCMVICGFNRWGLWGLRRGLTLRPRRGPWAGSFLSLGQVQDWTCLLGLELTSAAAVFYRPPIASARLLAKTAFLEAVGDRWWSLLSGAYVVVVKKRAFGQSAMLEPVRASRGRVSEPFVSAMPRHVAKRKVRV